jgi:hypothetical protein
MTIAKVGHEGLSYVRHSTDRSSVSRGAPLICLRLAEKYQLGAIGNRQLDEQPRLKQLGSVHHSIW